jgi:nucleotide-binding universal stress UspA family protein
MATLPVSAIPKSETRLKNILFATDFSEASMKAFPYAAALAKKFDAEVFACHIITPSSLVAAAPQVAPELYEAERTAAENELENIIRSPLLEGIKKEFVVSSGLLADCVAEEIKNKNVDLVIAGTHGRTGWRRLLLGSSVEAICRTATCPVLTVGPGLPPAPISFKRILLPTDLSDDSLRCLPAVAKLAAAFEASVTVLHVLPEETATNPDTRELSKPILRTLTGIFEPQLKPIRTEFAIESGDTSETILKVARDSKADLIALGIRNAFLPSLNIRTSVAYRVMAMSPCPVLTCR